MALDDITTLEGNGLEFPGALSSHVVYIIGDSHTGFWTGRPLSERRPFLHGINVVQSRGGFCKAFHLGPCLAYSANKRGSTFKCLEKIEFLLSSGTIPPQALIMICLGEIDLRVHVCNVPKQERLQRIKNSVNSLIELISSLKSLGYRPIGCGPIASQKDTWKLNQEFPRNGTEVERNFATKMFNELYRNECEAREVPFFTLFEEMVDENFRTKGEYIIDQCHLHESYALAAWNRLLPLLERNKLIARQDGKWSAELVNPDR
jgi:hypothetical protein